MTGNTTEPEAQMSQAVPFTTAEIHGLRDALGEIVADGATPGGVVVCGTAAGDRTVLTAGIVSPYTNPKAPDEHTVYDIASLTKVTATVPLVGRAVSAGLLHLDAPVREFLPPMEGRTPGGQATVRQLLSHTSGLRASTRLDLYDLTERPLYELICHEPMETLPGTHRYVNRGFILLGIALAHVHGEPLDGLAAALWAGLGMGGTAYGPLEQSPHVAPTEQRDGHDRVWGVVHDENAATMGGVAGHAGVFAPAADLATYAEHLLAGDEWFRAGLVPQAEIEPGLHRGLGWILAADGAVAYHHGFTGTSLHLAPGTGRYVAVTTNAVHNAASRTRIAPLRERALKTLCATA
ncbi:MULTISPECIES: serine hydrolase [unclassified Streptomyces]|uniref:serine hydrolase domain-containing protein n=1 Tax=unclassified Streptomyces TaxID=2593676 RepID=UPI00225921DB|nr:MULTISPECIES: serine hydrolase domain-containing protein [unclassified Streptomyces]MCX4527016.1 beta-lactamase family protein [Streptomyces sp. NBC_01551]MCX4542424.1 beta-lactamase family protein [Streptomyces sp. NBC_01565]